jgi:hypothetical protein
MPSYQRHEGATLFLHHPTSALKGLALSTVSMMPFPKARGELRRIPLPRLYEKSSNSDEPPRHEANHRSVHQRLAARTRSLVILAHPPVLIDPGDRPLDGLLANDKFCMSRHVRLSLSYSRRPNLTRRRTDWATDARAYPPAGITRHGGDDETVVARTSGNSETPGREATLGPGVPGHPAVEPGKRADSRSGRERRGGVP